MTSVSQIDVLFSGISNTSSYPPHNGLAVGPNNIVMAEGSRIEWTDLAGGTPTIQSVYSFFASLGATATNSLYDPRCIYDSASGRFIVIMENIGSNGAVSNIDIAVSKDSNPNDGWYFASLNTSLTINGQLTSSDRPSISVDANNIYISAPQYNVNVSGFAGTETWVIGKTAGAGGGLYNGGAMTVVANQVTPSNQGIFAVAAGNNGKTYYACDYSTGNQIVVVVQAYDVATSTFGPATTISLGNIDQGGAYTAQQQGTTLLLDAGDKRIQNLVYSNGFLYGVSEEKPIGSSVPLVHWFKIDVSNPGSPALVAQGDISGASLGTNVATFNASIAADAAGDVIINFTASGPNLYPSDYYVYRAASDPSGAFSAPVLYQASTSFFNSGNGSSVQRWGAYSTAIPDPTNPNAFWISNEYVASNWWQTSVAKVEITNSNVPIISSVATSGTGITNGNGVLGAATAVTLTVNFSGTVTVDMTNGSPAMTLNDGGSASYIGGSGSNALTFSYTVQAGQNTSDLIVSAISLNGATIQDGAGNNADLSGAINYNPAGTLQIDTAAPAAPTGLSLDTTTDSATKGDGITNVAQVKIDGTAEAGSTVTLYDTNGTTVLGSGTANATTGTFSIATSVLSDGAHAITAMATDAAGNTGAASTAYSVSIDTSAPAAPTGLSLDASTDSGTQGDGITNFTQVKIDGTAEPGSAVTLLDTNGTTVIGSGIASLSTGAFSINTSTLSAGTHSITATATDSAGNIGPSSSAYAVTVNAVPPAAPTGLTLDASTDSGTQGDGITNLAQVKIDGTAGPGNVVTLYDTNGVTVLGSGIADATTGIFSITTSTLSSGTHAVTAKAADSIGNLSAASAAYSVIIDTAAPVAPTGLSLDTTTDSATKGDGITNFTLVKIDGTAEAGSTVNLYDTNGTTVLGSGTANATTGAFSISTSALSSGTHSITAKATDAAGNTGAASTAYSLSIDTSAPAAPTGLSLDASTDSGTQGDGITSFTQLKIDGTAEPGSTVTLYDTNGTTVLGTGIAGAATGTFSVTTSTIANGVHNITAKATDVAGNVGTASAPYSVTVSATSTSEIETQFSGISDTSSYPPHNALAVGPNYIVMLEGSRIEWTNLAGSSAHLQSVYQFFKPLGTTATNSLFDPRAVYDSVNGRYIVTMDNIGSSGTISNIDIAVSKDSNPNDGWYFASLNTSLTINGQLTSSDTPVVSVDGSNIYITAPQYNVHSSGFQGTAVWVIGDGAGAGGGIYNGGAMTVTASETTSSSQGIYRVVAGGNGKTYYASSYSTGGQIVVTLQVYDVATNTFGPVSTVGLGNIDQGGSYTAQQQGTSLLLDATDKRVQNLAYSNGFLYGVTEEKPIGSSVPQVHWFKIDVSNPNSPTLVAQGDISGASLGTNVATFNGSIAADAAGDIIINFTASGPNMYPSDYYVYKAALDPSGAFSPPVLYQASSGFFNSGNGSSVQRWGINSTSIADPTDPHSFWISNEYVASGWWQTAVAQVQIQSTPETPLLTLGSNALTVNAGGSVALPISVAPFDADDTVSVTISGLAGYETVTDNLDQTTFSGNSITLSAAEVNSGLALHSSYGGSDHPVNTLTITASNTRAGEVATSAPQSIVVTDPPATPDNTASTGSVVPVSNTGFPPASMENLAMLMNQYMATGFHGWAGNDVGQGSLAPSTPAEPGAGLPLPGASPPPYTTSQHQWGGSGHIG